MIKNSNHSLKKNSLQVFIKRKGLHRNYFHKNYFSDVYHLVLSSSWFKFFFINVTLYIALNALFACFYYWGGDNILNADPDSFWDAFVFSFQTSTTIGYGHLLPANSYADILVIFDTLSGILFVAITTGLAFAKFSRPMARVVFSKNCVVNDFHGKKTLMFQIVNARDSHIAHARIKAAVVYFDYQTKDELSMENFFDLHLMRSSSPVFLTNWIVMHMIDSKSPLTGISHDELKQRNARIVISLTGVDDRSLQVVHASHVFPCQDIIYDKIFTNVITRKENGSIVIDYNKVHELKPFSPNPS